MSVFSVLHAWSRTMSHLLKAYHTPSLTQVAAAHPDRGIVQPAIKLHCTDTDTMFMQLEAMRQSIYEPMTNAMTALMGQSSYFGKALIKNKVYIEKVLGTRDNLIERVPVDVLSHDTFEAALLQPLYCGSVFLLEAPSYNYVTWNIRERRWNRGEVLLSMYFWKNALGVPMRWIQKKLQKDKFNPTKLRTESKLDFVTSYIAHSALRQMMMKPLLLVYIIIHYDINLLYRWASIIVVMFLVLVFPKFATCNRHNYKYVLLETLASFLQFTPEALVGCVRIVRAVQANLVVNAKWVPQRAVEEQFKQSNPFLSSFKHLWGYSAFGLVVGVVVAVFANQSNLLLVMLGTLFLLPLYTGFTSLTKDLKSSRAIARRREALERGSVATIAKPDAQKQGGHGAGLPPPSFTNLAFVSESPGSSSRMRNSLHIPRPILYPGLQPSGLQRALEAPDEHGVSEGNDSSSQTRDVARIPRPSLYPSLGLSRPPQRALEAYDDEHGAVAPSSGAHQSSGMNLPAPGAPVRPSAPPFPPELSNETFLSIPTAYPSSSFQANAAYHSLAGMS